MDDYCSITIENGRTCARPVVAVDVRRGGTLCTPHRLAARAHDLRERAAGLSVRREQAPESPGR